MPADIRPTQLEPLGSMSGKEEWMFPSPWHLVTNLGFF